MSRESNDHYDAENGKLIKGYDYKNQAWIRDGKYVRCGHLESMKCNCYGRLHEGEKADKN